MADADTRVTIYATGLFEDSDRPLIVAEVMATETDAGRLYEWFEDRSVPDRDGRTTRLTLHVKAQQRRVTWDEIDLGYGGDR